MKKISILFSALCAACLVGCVDTAGTRVMIDTETGDSSVLENSQRLANKLKVKRVTYDDVNGLKKATITLESTTKSRLSIQGRMVWFDVEGTELDAEGKSYRTMVLDGLDFCTFTGIAPNAKGVRAKLQVRITENDTPSFWGMFWWVWPGNW